MLPVKAKYPQDQYPWQIQSGFTAFQVTINTMIFWFVRILRNKCPEPPYVTSLIAGTWGLIVHKGHLARFHLVVVQMAGVQNHVFAVVVHIFHVLPRSHFTSLTRTELFGSVYSHKSSIRFLDIFSRCHLTLASPNCMCASGCFAAPYDNQRAAPIHLYQMRKIIKQDRLEQFNEFIKLPTFACRRLGNRWRKPIKLKWSSLKLL